MFYCIKKKYLGENGLKPFVGLVKCRKFARNL